MDRLTSIAFAATALIILSGCGNGPVTSHDQLIRIDEQQAHALGVEAYEQMKHSMPISDDRGLNRRVQEIGKRIAAVSPEPDWDWEFTVFEDESLNAFSLPGGKVGVNTGLVGIVENDDQLAAVIGHPIAQAVARHGVERLSHRQRTTTEAAGTRIAGGGQNASASDLAVAERDRILIEEADHLGLLYMAKAGYDPRAAVDLWRNMEAAGAGGDERMEFLSTHPSPGNRIARLQELMPEALEVYRPR